MLFSRLPYQSPISLRADAYGETALRLSCLAAMTTRATLDVPNGPDRWQAVDIYRPTRTPEPLPVFINTNGGACDARPQGVDGPQRAADRRTPAIHVSVSYRSRPSHRFPVPLEDCLDALAWTHANIDRFGGDPQRLFVGGHSAGGQLAARWSSGAICSLGAAAADVVKACFPTAASTT